MNEDGSYATVFMNGTDDKIKYNLYVYDQIIELTIPARAIAALVNGLRLPAMMLISR